MLVFWGLWWLWGVFLWWSSKKINQKPIWVLVDAYHSQSVECCTLVKIVQSYVAAVALTPELLWWNLPCWFACSEWKWCKSSLICIDWAIFGLLPTCRALSKEAHLIGLPFRTVLGHRSFVEISKRSFWFWESFWSRAWLFLSYHRRGRFEQF